MSSRYAEDDRRYRDRDGDRERSGRDRDDDRRPSGVDRRRDDDRYSDRRDDEERDRRGDKDERKDRDHRSGDRDRSPRPRHRSRSRSPEDRDRRSHDRRRRHKSRDSRSDESSSSSGSDSEDSYDRERRRRKEKKRDKRDGRDKESREERKARKEKKRKEKKEKKKAKKHKSLAVTSQWGTYGIISEADRANKDPEFRAWLVEERTVNPETLPKDKEKKEFLRFIEDFNTATLPSEKYYDMAKYEIKMKMLRTGEVTSQNDDAGYDPMKDLMSHNSSLKRKPAETDTYLNKAELEELRNVQRERSEMAQRKLLGMDISKNLGVRQEAADRLFR